MVNVCFYFQVHQPIRTRRYSIFDIGNNQNYFDEAKNKEIFNKVARKCYLPMNKLLLNKIREIPEFKVSFSLSGVYMDQMEKYNEEVMNSFQELNDTGNVEFLSETYHHSLSSLYSHNEFKQQIVMHKKNIKRLFQQKPKVFRNTELVFNNEIAKTAQELGYKAVLAEGADHVLQWRSPNFVYNVKGSNNIKLLTKNYRLSDDIAFRFSEKSWADYPLTADKFANWVSAVNGNGEIVNLFMDYETFGEHQWADSGIFEFMKALPHKILEHQDNKFISPSEAAKYIEPKGELDIPHVVSWADVERDVSAWLGNAMQRSAARKIYELEKSLKDLKDPELLKKWRLLQTSDHFYYMCTKWFNDGDVHKYFNAFDNPYEAFTSYMNIMNDLQSRIEKKRGEKNGK